MESSRIFFVHFYSCGDPENLRNSKVRTRENLGMNIPFCNEKVQYSLEGDREN
jgi:hypothetical protein